MDTTENKKDIIEFKQAMEIIPSAEMAGNSYLMTPLTKNILIYKKKIEGDDTITTIAEGTLTNVAADKWFQVMTDIPTILKGDTPLKEIKCIEKFSNNNDVVYMEMKLPFPMSNRDLLQKRLFLGNKEDPALVKELGLYDWSHRYYVISCKSVERADVPVKKDIVRGTTKMNYCLIEEDPQAWNKIKIRQVACQEMGGNIPKSVLNNFGAKGAQKRFETLLETYAKCFSS